MWKMEVQEQPTQNSKIELTLYTKDKTLENTRRNAVKNAINLNRGQNIIKIKRIINRTTTELKQTAFTISKIQILLFNNYITLQIYCVGIGT